MFVEVDVGQGRCGAPAAAAGQLAQRVVSHAPPEGGLRFAGLQAYHGAAQHLRGAAERAAASHHAASLARAAQASIGAAGIDCPLVTGAGTGTFAFDAASGVWGELQAGSYLFMDRDYADNAPAPGAPRFEHALFVKSRVMSRGAAHAVIDAGHKSHAIDSGLPRVWQRDLVYANGGDEHGILRPPAGASADVLPALGDTVWLVPGHCDPTVNLHDRYVVVRGGLEPAGSSRSGRSKRAAASADAAGGRARRRRPTSSRTARRRTSRRERAERHAGEGGEDVVARVSLRLRARAGVDRVGSWRLLGSPRHRGARRGASLVRRRAGGECTRHVGPVTYGTRRAHVTCGTRAAAAPDHNSAL